MCPRCSNRHYLLIAIVDQFLGLNLYLIHFSTLIIPWMCNFCWHQINLIFSFSSEFYFLISICSMTFYKFRFLDHLALFLEDPQFPFCLKHFWIHRNAMGMPARVIAGWSCHCATIHQHLKLFQNKLWNHHYELLISQYHTLHTTIGHVVTIFFYWLVTIFDLIEIRLSRSIKFNKDTIFIGGRATSYTFYYSVRTNLLIYITKISRNFRPFR